MYQEKTGTLRALVLLYGYTYIWCKFIYQGDARVLNWCFLTGEMLDGRTNTVSLCHAHKPTNILDLWINWLGVRYKLPDKKINEKLKKRK